jgi:recombination protein RecA
VGLELGIIRKSGAWFYLDEDRLGQGRENVKEFLDHNTDVLDSIERRIREMSPELQGRDAFVDELIEENVLEEDF